MIYRFEHFEVDLTKFEIRSHSEIKSVEPKVFDLIVYLIQNRQRIVSRDELFEQVWNNREVSDTTLSNHIKSARKVLGDDGEQQRVVKTIRSRGYQFIMDVETSSENDSQHTDNKGSQQPGDFFVEVANPPSREQWPLWKIVAPVLPLLFVVVLWFGAKFEPEAEEPYILVVPLSVSSSNPQILEPFSDQITREIIQALRKVSAVKTIPPPSSFTFKNNKRRKYITEQIPQLTYVLDGVVSEDDNGNVRLTVELEELSGGRLLWDGDYDFQLKDGNRFNLQSQIATSVAESLQVLVHEDEKQVLAQVPQPQPDAYEQYVKGQYQLSLMTQESVLLSIDNFSAAISIDPNYLAPYKAKADAFRILMTLFDKPRDVLPKVISSAIDVLTIEPDSPQVMTSLGLAYVHAWQWEDAWRLLSKAQRQDPNIALTELGFALYYSAMGDAQAVRSSLAKADSLDPLNEEIAEWGMWALMMVDAIDDAIEWGERKKLLHPNISYPLLSLAVGEYMRGNVQKSIKLATQGVSLSQQEPFPLIVLAQAHAYAGNEQQAMNLITQAKQKNKYMCPYETAIIHAKLGNVETMYDLLDSAIDYQSNCLIFVHNDPRFSEYRKDERFQLVLKKVGLSDSDIKQYPK